MSALWLPAIVVMGAIFLLSAQTYQQQTIRPELWNAIHRTALADYLAGIRIRYGSLTIDGATDGPADVLEFLLRKLAHVIEYMLLGMCLLRAIRWTAKLRFRYAALLALALAAGFAATDEYHQLFVQNRGARPLDVLLDAAGTFVGIAAYGLFLRRKRSKIKSYATEGL